MTVPAAVVHAVINRCSRDGVPCCEVCGEPLKGERGVDWALHHRRYRDGAPGQDDADNLLAVHGASNVDQCHGEVHADKGNSMYQGWSISRHSHDPAGEHGVLISNDRWVYLGRDGQYYDDPLDTP